MLHYIITYYIILYCITVNITVYIRLGGAVRSHVRRPTDPGVHISQLPDGVGTHWGRRRSATVPPEQLSWQNVTTYSKMWQHMSTCGNLRALKATYGNMYGIRGPSLLNKQNVPTPSGCQ